jgi:GldM C-terminal domain
MRLIILLIAFSLSGSVKAQETAIVRVRPENRAYMGINNPISFFADGYKFKVLTVTTNNGKITKTDGRYWFMPSRQGTAKLTIYKKHNGKLINLGSHIWYVVSLPLPIATVGSYPNGSTVPKGAISAQMGIGAYEPYYDVGLCMNFIVDSFSVVIMKNSVVQFSAHNKGNAFSEDIKAAFSKMEPGSIVLLSDIWITNYYKEAIKLDPLEYLIK